MPFVIHAIFRPLTRSRYAAALRADTSLMQRSQDIGTLVAAHPNSQVGPRPRHRRPPARPNNPGELRSFAGSETRRRSQRLNAKKRSRRQAFLPTKPPMTHHRARALRRSPTIPKLVCNSSVPGTHTPIVRSPRRRKALRPIVTDCLVAIAGCDIRPSRSIACRGDRVQAPPCARVVEPVALRRSTEYLSP